MLRIIYIIVTVWLTIYSVQSLILSILYLRHRRATPLCTERGWDWPRVAVQLPIYNEMHVVERLIDAAANLDYPRSCLEIQVLDDSTDDTTRIAEARAAYHRERGVNVHVLHRTDRTGFKAGALAAGMAASDAEFLAIFDADFLPQRDFLTKTVPHFYCGPRVGAVQVRWSHLNDIYSPLTRAQALMLDGHFVVEQTARNRGGLLMQFNGSGGLWRREAVAEAGGWQADTMTEDMDLSYRAQIQGWRIVYLPEEFAPAELPPQMQAYKQQQARWAQGSMQCLRKLSLPVLRSNLTFKQKLGAIVHMSTYLAQPLVILLLLISLPMLLDPQSMPRFLGWFGLLAVAPLLPFTISQLALHRDWEKRMMYLPVLSLVGMGIAWSTTRAVLKGLAQWGGTFARTPKFRIEGRDGRWKSSLYRLVPDKAFVGEIVLALYAGVSITVAWLHGNYAAVPYLSVYMIGFGLVAALGFFQATKA